MSEEHIIVRRDGAVEKLPIDRLVPGDVVDLMMGGVATADARPAHVNGARIVDAQGHAMTVRGVTWGGGFSPFARTTNNADNVCILLGSATRVVGGLAYAIY